jgi:hypothetical protein
MLVSLIFDKLDFSFNNKTVKYLMANSKIMSIQYTDISIILELEIDKKVYLYYKLKYL